MVGESFVVGSNAGAGDAQRRRSDRTLYRFRAAVRKVVKNGTLKTYKDFPHGMPTTHAKDGQCRPVGVPQGLTLLLCLVINGAIGIALELHSGHAIGLNSTVKETGYLSISRDPLSITSRSGHRSFTARYCLAGVSIRSVGWTAIWITLH
jgi:hypothetical protein